MATNRCRRRRPKGLQLCKCLHFAYRRPQPIPKSAPFNNVIYVYLISVTRKFNYAIDPFILALSLYKLQSCFSETNARLRLNSKFAESRSSLHIPRHHPSLMLLLPIAAVLHFHLDADPIPTLIDVQQKPVSTATYSFSFSSSSTPHCYHVVFHCSRSMEQSPAAAALFSTSSLPFHSASFSPDSNRCGLRGRRK
jgi:hypothetical protein